MNAFLNVVKNLVPVLDEDERITLAMILDNGQDGKETMLHDGTIGEYLMDVVLSR